MIYSLRDSLKFLLESFVIVLIFTFFFALIGLHLFNGIFHNKCFDNLTGIIIS